MSSDSANSDVIDHPDPDSLGVPRVPYDPPDCLGCRNTEPSVASPRRTLPSLRGCDMPHDSVESPSHYTRGGIEVRHVVDAYRKDGETSMDHDLASAIEYQLRAGHKGGPHDELQDIRKAIKRLGWYEEKLARRLGVSA
jgi:hypothetical protein